MTRSPVWALALTLASSAWAADPPPTGMPAPTPAMPAASAGTAPGAATAAPSMPGNPAGLSPPVSQAGFAPSPSTPVPNAPTDYKKFRDPFKEPSVVEASEIRSDLERYAVTDFKVVAIITGPIRMRAMITAPDGKTHYVSEKMKIGLRDGVIVKITTKSIVVREKVVNPLGEVEQFDTEIGMDQPGSGTSQ